MSCRGGRERCCRNESGGVGEEVEGVGEIGEGVQNEPPPTTTITTTLRERKDRRPKP